MIRFYIEKGKYIRLWNLHILIGFTPKYKDKNIIKVEIKSNKTN